MPELSADELSRYARHVVLPEVGEAGQCRLKESSVLIVGAGGLGSPLALYLAAAGVGRLGLVEFDQVDEANLQRQVLYGTPDVGRPKIEAAVERLSALNPFIRVEAHPVRLDADNAREIIERYDLVADGADNFSTRYLVNDACVLLGKPDVQGSVLRFEGQVAVFDARSGPCYRCLFPDPPPPESTPSCAEGGVLGVLPGVVGTLQAVEAVKLLLGIGLPLVGRLLVFDALSARFREFTLDKDPSCPICGPAPSIVDLREAGAACGAAGPTTLRGTRRDGDPAREIPGGPAHGVPGGGADGPFDPDLLEITPEDAARALALDPPPVLLDVREPIEVRICSLPGMKWIPLGELPSRLGELERDRPIIVYCHIGARSWQAARFLRARGFAHTWSLAGGIDAWARRLDRSVRTY